MISENSAGSINRIDEMLVIQINANGDDDDKMEDHKTAVFYVSTSSKFNTSPLTTRGVPYLKLLSNDLEEFPLPHFSI